MTDDSTSIPTVGDDEIGSLEDREVRPLSSTINPSPQHGGGFSICGSSNLGDSPTTAPAGDPAYCATTVRHTVASEPSANRYAVRDSGSWSCITTLYHKIEVPISGATAPKRSGNGRLEPSGKPSPSAPRRRTSGLIVRGEVWYLRLRVPRHLQAQMGR